jgi:hypothetical protein
MCHILCLQSLLRLRSLLRTLSCLKTSLSHHQVKYASQRWPETTSPRASFSARFETRETRDESSIVVVEAVAPQAEGAIADSIERSDDDIKDIDI